MASPSLLLLPFLLFTSLLFTFTRSSPIISDNVNLNLYYESLCPACQHFIVDELIKVFKTDLHTIVNLKLVPSRNAITFDSNKTIVCQHGEDECYLNAIEACAINIWPNQKKYFGFIHCVESALQYSKEPQDAWKQCAHKYGGLKQITKCYDSRLAMQLILGYGNEIDKLKPPHEYVPWVTVNGTPLRKNYVDFVAEVCKAYKGADALPEVCKSSASTKLAKPKFGSNAGKMTMYKLAMMWGFGYCEARNIACKDVKDYFTIHGFWPSDAAGVSLPPYDKDKSCNPTDEPHVLTLKSVQLLIGRIQGMNETWPSYTGNNAVFWKYEWDEHGKCCTIPRNPIDYFTKAVYLARRVNLKENLKKHGIVPVKLDYNHIQGISAKTFYDATLAQLQKTPEINCYSRYDAQRKTMFYFLSEIRLCFNDKFQLIDCPQGYSGVCSTNPALKIMYITK